MVKYKYNVGDKVTHFRGVTIYTIVERYNLNTINYYKCQNYKGLEDTFKEAEILGPCRVEATVAAPKELLRSGDIVKTVGHQFYVVFLNHFLDEEGVFANHFGEWVRLNDYNNNLEMIAPFTSRELDVQKVYRPLFVDSMMNIVRSKAYEVIWERKPGKPSISE